MFLLVSGQTVLTLKNYVFVGVLVEGCGCNVFLKERKKGADDNLISLRYAFNVLVCDGKLHGVDGIGSRFFLLNSYFFFSNPPLLFAFANYKLMACK